MDALLADLRYAVRTLARARLFTAIAVLTLALGIGANAAIFSVVNGILLTPLPVDEPERLVWLQGKSPQGYEVSVSIPNLLDWREQARTLPRMGAFRTSSLNLTGGERPERLLGVQVLGDLFPTLGVAPQLGRAIPGPETMPGGPRVAVLSHGFWTRRFGAAPGVLGSTITLDGQPFTVVGVMPRDFVFPSNQADLFVPMGVFAAQLPWTERGDHPGMYAVARLAPGATLEQARADMQGVMNGIKQRTGYENDAELLWLRDRALGSIEPALLVLWGAVGFVLLIACANVANLLLARGEGRQRELAVRAALGAGRGRLVRQLLTESVVLALAGGLAGIALAAVGIRLLVASLPASTPLIERVSLSGPVLLFALALAMTTGLLFGLVPALRAVGPALHGTLKEGRGTGTGAGRQRLRSTLVVAEITTALVLLVGAGLLLKSFARLQEVDPGFDAARVLTVRLSLPEGKYEENQRWHAVYRELLERASAIPGVSVAALNNGIPLASGGTESGVIAEGQPVDPQNMESTLWQSPSAGYFEAMRIPLVKGRYFTESDRAGGQMVAIVDESMARRFWPDADPIGQRLAFEFEGEHGGEMRPVWRTVVGVVANVRYYELASPSRVQVYRPFDQRVYPGAPDLTLFVRATGDPAALAGSIRQAVAAVDPDLPTFQVRTMDDIVAEELSVSRLLGGLLGVFAAIALTLAAIGIYGVMSYTVTMRAHEFGVRLALGALPGDVVALMVRRGAVLAAAGLALGTVAALAAARGLAGTLYDVSATDPAVFLGIPLLLGAVALVASWVPARRATRIDPATALRAE